MRNIFSPSLQCISTTSFYSPKILRAEVKYISFFFSRRFLATAEPLKSYPNNSGALLPPQHSRSKKERIFQVHTLWREGGKGGGTNPGAPTTLFHSSYPPLSSPTVSLHIFLIAAPLFTPPAEIGEIVRDPEMTPPVFFLLGNIDKREKFSVLYPLFLAILSLFFSISIFARLENIFFARHHHFPIPLLVIFLLLLLFPLTFRLLLYSPFPLHLNCLLCVLKRWVREEEEEEKRERNNLSCPVVKIPFQTGF